MVLFFSQEFYFYNGILGNYIIKEASINFTSKFCGTCGSPVGDENIQFCGECGAPIVKSSSENEQTQTTSRPRRINPPPKSVNKQDVSQPPKSESVPPAPANAARECDSVLSKNSINSGMQWAVIWLIGWLPIGILFSSFYDSLRAGNPKWYSNYPRTWDTTLPGMLTTYGIGSLFGGFIAGLLIYRLLNTKKLSIGAMGTLPALAWGFLWGGVLAVMTILLEKYMDDGTLIITIPIFALIFGGLVSRFSIQLLEKKYTFSITKRIKMFVAGGWAGCSLIGVIIAMIISGA